MNITGFDHYQDLAWELVLPQCKNAPYLALGLGEVGEIQGKIKKILRGDRSNMTAAQIKEKDEEIKAELGDAQFYLATLAKLLGFKMSEIATGNIDKLYDRKARGVLQGDGDNR